VLGHKFSLFLQTSGQFLWTKSGRLRLLSTGCECRKEIFFQSSFTVFVYLCSPVPFSLLAVQKYVDGGFSAPTVWHSTEWPKKLQKFVDLSWNGELRIVLANYWTTLWISCLENLIVYSMFYVDCHGPGHNHIVYKLVTDSLCPFLPPPCYIPLQCYTQLTFGCEGRTNWSTRGVCVKFCRFSFLYIFDPTFFCNLALAFVWYQIVHVSYFSAKKHCPPRPPPPFFLFSQLTEVQRLGITYTC